MRSISILLWSSALILVGCTGENGDRSENSRRITVSQNYGKVKNSIRRTRPSLPPPPYAVQMEPLVQYSLRDPLYHQKVNRSQEPVIDIKAESSENVEETLPYGNPETQRYDQGPSGYLPQYYHDPEPIIEIIIKESNESLPAPPTPPPPPPTPRTKEPVHVFYIKYKKNPNPKGKYGEDDIIYEPPVPAVTPPSSEPEQEHNHQEHEVEPEPAYPRPTLPPPPSTTLRTIIRPDSEVYHGTGGIKITFGGPEREEYGPSHGHEHGELEEQSAPEPQVALPTAQNQESLEVSSQTHQLKRQSVFHHQPQQPQLQSYSKVPEQAQYHPTSAPSQVSQEHSFQRPLPPQSQKQYVQLTPPRPPGYHPQNVYRTVPTQPTQQVQPSQTFESSQPQQRVNYNYQNHQPVRQPPQPPQQPQQPQNVAKTRQKFVTPTPAQIQQYQQEKQRLYQQSLKQQQSTQVSLTKSYAQPYVPTGNPPTQNNHNPFLNHRVQQPIHVPGPVQAQPFQRPTPLAPTSQQYPSLITPSPASASFQHPNVNSQQSHFTVSEAKKAPEYVRPQPQPVQYYQGHQAHSLANHPQNYQQPQNNHYHQLQPNHGHQQNNAPLVHVNHHSSDYSLASTKAPPPQPTTQRLQQYNSTPKQTFADGEIVKSISQHEDHQIQTYFKDPTIYNQPQLQQNVNRQQDFSQSFNQGGRPQASASAESGEGEPTVYIQPNSQHRYRPAYPTSTTGKNFATNYYSTTPSPKPTSNKVFSLLPTSSTESSEVNDSHFESHRTPGKDEGPRDEDKKKANIAALPDEVPDDLREQLLSSGILSNADIQVLDYDKVGDIPIESLPPEALENFYGAGSAPVPSVVRPERSSPVEMKVVRYDPSTKEGQVLADKYVREDATQLDPVVLNDSRYNRYLPLKVNGSQFPIPDVPQLRGRIVNSVVVLAPVDYDFVKDEPVRDERGGRAIQVQGVRFIAGEPLRDLVKQPSAHNYYRWLEKERSTPSENQSVVLLVTRGDDDSKKSEIFMYDIATSKVNKLRGELSSTFVEVAESNSASQDIDELSGSDDTQISTDSPVIQSNSDSSDKTVHLIDRSDQINFERT